MMIDEKKKKNQFDNFLGKLRIDIDLCHCHIY